MFTLSNDKSDSAVRAPRLRARPDQAPCQSARRALIVLANISAPSLLILSLARAGPAGDLMPWYFSVAALCGFSLSQLVRGSHDHAELIISSTEPVGFSETFAFSFFGVALLIFLTGTIMPTDERSTPARIVDIQFVSKRDAANLDLPLPGTVADEQELRKRRGDQLTVQGSLSPVLPQSAASRSVPARVGPVEPPHKSRHLNNVQLATTAVKQETRAPEGKAASNNPGRAQATSKSKTAATEKVPAEATPACSEGHADTHLVIPSTWSTVKVSIPAMPIVRHNRPDSRRMPFISEVEPPELVELIENDGEASAMQIYQRGGRSIGGRGAENSLSRYLKDLHRRIKSAWSPPKGVSRRVELLFRIGRDGRVETMQIRRSSGEPITDKSAISAIVAATRDAYPLPGDFESPYLDILYTFNYNVDELQEVNSQDANS